MRTLEGIRYLINLDSAEIQQNFAGGVAPPDKVESEVDTTWVFICQASHHIFPYMEKEKLPGQIF